MSYRKLLIIMSLVGIFTLGGCSKDNVLRSDPVNTTSSVHTEVSQHTKVIESKDKSEDTARQVGINQYHPVIYSIYDGATVLGGSKDGRWYFPECMRRKSLEELADGEERPYKVEHELLKGDEVFKVYSKNGYIGEVKAAGTPSYYEYVSTGDEVLTFPLESKFESYGPLVIGVNGEWDAMPRKLKNGDEKNTYKIDMDNDGKEEIIRRIDDKSNLPERVLFSSKLEIIKDDISIVVYSFESTFDGARDYNWSVLDLNGDGKYEVITEEEGHCCSFQVHNIENYKSEVIFRHYWGDV